VSSFRSIYFQNKYPACNQVLSVIYLIVLYFTRRLQSEKKNYKNVKTYFLFKNMTVYKYNIIMFAYIIRIQPFASLDYNYKIATAHYTASSKIYFKSVVIIQYINIYSISRDSRSRTDALRRNNDVHNNIFWNWHVHTTCVYWPSKEVNNQQTTTVYRSRLAARLKCIVYYLFYIV